MKKYQVYRGKKKIGYAGFYDQTIEWHYEPVATLPTRKLAAQLAGKLLQDDAVYCVRIEEIETP